MKKLFLFVPLFLLTASSNLNDVNVDKTIYKVYYSQRFEQPLELTYESTNRPTNVNRGSMDFYGEPGVKTSDNADYANNIYDKGHLAPAATFSDNMVNLKLTFSYLNSALQNQYLNRGEWRLLEEQERKWDDVENLTVKISVDFKGKNHKYYQQVRQFLQDLQNISTLKIKEFGNVIISQTLNQLKNGVNTK